MLWWRVTEIESERERLMNTADIFLKDVAPVPPYETDVEPVEVECHRRGMFQKNPACRCLYLGRAGVSCLSH